MLSTGEYLKIRKLVIDHGQDLDWLQHPKRPTTAEKMSEHIIYTQMGSFWKETNVGKYFPKVMAALRAGTPVRQVFKNKRKAKAIEFAWRNRDRLFAELKTFPTSFNAPCYEVTKADLDLVEWCDKIPYLGEKTKFLAAREFGANVPKPDIWMERFAAYSGEEVLSMCKRLARATGDRIAVVDLVLWYAGSRGLFKLSGGKPSKGSPKCKSSRGS